MRKESKPSSITAIIYMCIFMLKLRPIKILNASEIVHQLLQVYHISLRPLPTLLSFLRPVLKLIRYNPSFLLMNFRVEIPFSMFFS